MENQLLKTPYRQFGARRACVWPYSVQFIVSQLPDGAEDGGLNQAGRVPSCLIQPSFCIQSQYNTRNHSRSFRGSHQQISPCSLYFWTTLVTVFRRPASPLLGERPTLVSTMSPICTFNPFGTYIIIAFCLSALKLAVKPPQQWTQAITTLPSTISESDTPHARIAW